MQCIKPLPSKSVLSSILELCQQPVPLQGARGVQGGGGGGRRRQGQLHGEEVLQLPGGRHPGGGGRTEAFKLR